MSVLEMIGLIAVMVLLPIIPAFLLFRFLPSEAKAEGPWKGLKIKLGGAFGGYFLVLLMLIGFYEIFLTGQYKPWTIVGKIKLSDGATINTETIKIMVEPPDRAIGTDGSFAISGIYLTEKEGEKPPKLMIEETGYSPQGLVLQESNFEDQGILSKKGRTIFVKTPIELIRKGELEKYDPKNPLNEKLISNGEVR